jgi:hypothetical protein
MGEERITIGARRRAAEKPARRKVTAELLHGDEALVRVVARDWGLSLGDTLGVMARCLVASGWSDREVLTIGPEGAQRIRDAVARWRATQDAPVLDPGIHTGQAAGREAGVGRGESPSVQAGRKAR